MVSVNLKGGIGNMLFQIAFIEDLARRGGFEVRYPDIDNVFQTLLKSGHSQNCYDYLSIFRNFDWRKNQDKPMPNRIVHIPHHYEYIEPVDDMIYDGYFQSERYFDRGETLKLFEPAEFIKRNIKINSVSIHVRRGDYISKYSDTYEELTSDYYIKALKEIGKYNEVYVFSDNKIWCVDNFPFDCTLPNNSDYVQMFMMAQCRDNIIANSSFSWWGAYLNQNPDKKVIAPAKWYKTDRYSAKDIYTSNMIII